MSKKFSFLIIVESNGTYSSKVYEKENAQDGLNEFSKVRSQGKEAHFFHFPKADKRCKSASDIEEMESAIGTRVPQVESIEPVVQKTSKKSGKSSEPKSLDIE